MERIAPRVMAGILGALLASGSTSALPNPQSPVPNPQSLIFFCPMHLDVTAREPGKCGRCGMVLVAGDPWDEREFLLDMQTDPPAPVAGSAVRFRFGVTDPATKQTVKDFAVVHDRQFHLFVVSQDLEHFAHIHPEMQDEGSWTIEHTLPKAGAYRVYSDFLPLGGTPQVIARTLVTRGHAPDLSSSVARLVPDTTRMKIADGTTVRLRIDPAQIVAGQMVKLRFYLTESAGERPVEDLEPYLAAWGHTLILSEDALEYVHAHPIEYLPADVSDAKGGPTITFDAMFPKPGRYRLWTQFKRRGVVSTVWFTVEAGRPS